MTRRRIGANMRRVLIAMERLARELGRPPFLVEISAALDMTPQAIHAALTTLVVQEFVEAPARGCYVQVRTLDGRAVRYSVEVG